MILILVYKPEKCLYVVEQKKKTKLNLIYVRDVIKNYQNWICKYLIFDFKIKI